MNSFDKHATPRHRIVICGSMAFYSDMVDIKHQLSRSRLESVVPETDDIFFHSAREEDIQQAKRRASMRHIRRVRDQKTFGILVVNRDKHGIADYIGPNTFAEIAIAFAHYKKVYLYQGIPAFYRDELSAWGVNAIDTDLETLARHVHDYILYEARQMQFEFSA